MVKTLKKKLSIGTRKNLNRVSYSLVSFQKEITVVFLEMLLMIKLFHWKTYSYATHKATDKLYTKLNNFKVNDTFIEKNVIPEAFIQQLNDFLIKMSDVNVETIEKQNLVLTCFKSLHNLNCDYFLNKKIIQTMLIPKYKEWINIFNFE